jgi:hypothetical protein
MNGIEIETELFEHRAVKPDAINQCSFGQDFATWLQERLRSLTGDAYVFSNPIQEDYGWGFWASGSGDRFWIAVSYVGDGPQNGPAQWIVSVEQTSAANLIRRMLHKSDAARLSELRHSVQRALEGDSAIKILDPNRMH